MTESQSAVTLFAVLLIPIGLFLAVRATVQSAAVRLCLSLLISVLAGATSYYLAVNYDWRPTFKGGRLNLNPVVLGAGHSIAMFIVFTLLQYRLGRVRTRK